MRFLKFIAIPLFLFTISGKGQHSEIGIIGGTAYYLGELNPSKHIINKVNPTIGLFYRKNLSKRYALRFGANYGRLGATDDITASELSKFRQLSFSASLLEGYGILEFNFLPYQINNYTTSLYTPYVFIGVAGFRTSSEITNDGIYFVQKNATSTSVSMPFGLGIKFDLSGNLGMALEWGMRKTWVDEIDGLTESYDWGYQLNNTQNKDWYAIVGITLNYKILTQSDHCPGVIN